MMRIAVLALVVLCAGCGGGGGSDGAPAAKEVVAQPVAVAMYGDSTQEGRPPNWGAPPYTPPSTSAQAEMRRLTGIDVTVTSYGIGMTDSWQLLTGTDGSGMPWAQRIAASGAKYVTINHAINDNGRNPEEYRYILGELVRQVQAQGKIPVLETPNPIVSGGAISWYYSIPAHEAKVQTVREVARDAGAVLCDEYASIKADHRDTLADMPDGVHGTPEFYAYKGRLLAACLAPLITSP